MKRHSSFRDPFLQAVATQPGLRLGALHAIVGGKRRGFDRAVSTMRSAGHVFLSGQTNNRRYFITEALAAACAASDTVASRIERRRLALNAYQRKVYADLKALQPPKPARVRVEKPKREPRQPKPAKTPRAKAVNTANRFQPETQVRRHGPAMLDAPADYSKASRFVVPRALGRYEVAHGFCGPFGMVGVGRDVMTGRAWV